MHQNYYYYYYIVVFAAGHAISWKCRTRSVQIFAQFFYAHRDTTNDSQLESKRLLETLVCFLSSTSTVMTSYWVGWSADDDFCHLFYSLLCSLYIRRSMMAYRISLSAYIYSVHGNDNSKSQKINNNIILWLKSGKSHVKAKQSLFQQTTVRVDMAVMMRTCVPFHSFSVQPAQRTLTCTRLKYIFYSFSANPYCLVTFHVHANGSL